MLTSFACKTVRMSPQSAQYNCDSVGVIVSQTGCVTEDQGQILNTELNLLEMTDVEYTHLQHIIQTHMESQTADPDGSGDSRFNSTIFAVGSPAQQPTNTKVEIEYTATSSHTTPSNFPSTLTDGQSILTHSAKQDQFDVQGIKMVLVSDADGISGERTPTSCGEVPGSVLAKVRSAGDTTGDGCVEPFVNGAPLLARPNPPARVRLEKRFNCGEFPRQQDSQSVALTNFLTMLQHSSEAQEASMHPQMQKWMRSDRSNPIELSHTYGGSFNPIAGFRGQGFGNTHVLETNKHQGLIIPKNFTFSCRQERMSAKTPCINNASPTDEQVWVKVENDGAAVRTALPAKRAKIRGPRSLKATTASTAGSADVNGAGGATGGTRKRGGGPVESSQRRERHNSKERDRRRRIRFCCDELNLLAPFCNHETDKATTLQWTTAFLKYIREVYGDSIKQEFQSTFCGKTGLRLKPSGVSSQILVHQETAETHSAPQAAEQ
ncbi:transcription factor-like 5 protein isoform X1 [Osmerus eperlanus]|uniref:transcription factor-like 5 protein isoform X1 n=1 Tax=Osmerus eperlanus TaxID=29151 RepID=UPI002E15BC59